MNNTKSIKQYDLFKLIVTIVLLLAFLLFLLLASKQDSAPPSDVPHLSTPTSDSISQATASPTISAPPTPAAAETQQPLPTDAPTEVPSATPTATNTPTPALSTDSSADEVSADISTCDEIAKSQLQAGMTVTINQRLNFRSSPEIKSNRILTHSPESKAQVVGGPVCTRYLDGGAYLWWHLELPNGLVGWSAEASIFGDYYFMEPAE